MKRVLKSNIAAALSLAVAAAGVALAAQPARANNYPSCAPFTTDCDDTTLCGGTAFVGTDGPCEYNVVQGVNQYYTCCYSVTQGTAPPQHFKRTYIYRVSTCVWNGVPDPNGLPCPAPDPNTPMSCKTVSGYEDQGGGTDCTQ